MRLVALLTMSTALVPASIGPPSGAPGADDFRMTVADVFAITGGGVVVTGTVEGGPVRVKDVVCLRPADGETREVTVEGIERFRDILEVAEPGTQVGLLFTGLERDDVQRGDTLTASC